LDLSQVQLCHINTLFERVEAAACTLDPGGNGIQIEVGRSAFARVYCASSMAMPPCATRLESKSSASSILHPISKNPSLSPTPDSPRRCHRHACASVPHPCVASAAVRDCANQSLHLSSHLYQAPGTQKRPAMGRRTEGRHPHPISISILIPAHPNLISHRRTQIFTTYRLRPHLLPFLWFWC
jgi:hypothetical protein